MRLWYQSPAEDWNSALPLGNGKLGAMVFGGPVAERIQLNEDSVWSGGFRDRVNPDCKKQPAGNPPAAAGGRHRPGREPGHLGHGRHPGV